MTFSVYFISAFFLFGAIIFFGIRAVDGSLLEFEADENRFLAGAPPLSLADLTDTDMASYVTRRSGDESILLARYEIHQHVDWQQDQALLGLPSMDYAVTEVKLPFLYDMCRETVYRDQMKYAEYFDYTYAERDPAPWDAKQVWEKTGPDGYSWNQFLLCHDDRIIEIDFDWSPTPEQMAIVGERLGG